MLTAAIFLPIVGAALLALIPRDREEMLKAVALLVTAATAVIGLALLFGFDYDDAGSLQFESNTNWIEVINSRYHIGIDGFSLPLMILSMVITVLCVIYSWDHFPEPHNPKAFLILMLVLETGMNGTFAAQDLILFFVFFELVLLPMYFMIGVWGGPNRQYAALLFGAVAVLAMGLVAFT